MFRYAKDAYLALDGLFCVYKPSDVSCSSVIRKLKTKLCSELNKLELSFSTPIIKINRDVYEGNSEYSSVPSVTTVPDLLDHPLVIGKCYMEDDLNVCTPCVLVKKATGVLVVGIGPQGVRRANLLQKAKFLQQYELHWFLGRDSDDGFEDGNNLRRSSFQHVKKGRLNQLLATQQATQQLLAFQYAGVPLDSQEAYELASKGLVKPMLSNHKQAVIYGLKCTQFNLPHFSIEAHVINDNGRYLVQTLQEVAHSLRSVAVCSSLRRARLGHFTADTHCLERSEWSLENIVRNIRLCAPLAEQRALSSPAHVESSLRHLTQANVDINLLEA